MTITLRIAPRADAWAAVLRDPQLVRAVDPTGTIVEIDTSDPLLDRFLELTRHTAGSFFNPVMTFTPAELSQARYVQADCRGKIVRESARDYEANRARLDALDFHHVDGGPLRIKIIDRLTFSKIDIPANAIGCAGDWMAEFIVGAAVASALRAASLSGYELRPVYHPKTGEAHPEFFHLYTKAIMPPAQLDATTIPLNTETRGWRELGCLSYSVSGQLEDLNRTAENFSNNYMPLWVVSARVRACVLAAKLKGWAFRPVLEPGTPLHEAYRTLWSDLLSRTAVNPRNRF